MTEQPTQNDHDLLIRIDTRLQDLVRDNNEFRASLSKLDAKKLDKDEASGKIDAHKKEVGEQLRDHERRMRRLERYIYIASGVLLFLEFIFR